jgi:asparagine synthase (glutamine-hydrolysing)
MFAFGIWDNVEKKLFLARDRLGQKPLYYYSSAHEFMFASELIAFENNPLFNLTPSLEAINCYLALGYILNPLSLYENIYQVEPGHYLEINSDGKIISKRQYWDYSKYFYQKNNSKINEIDFELKNKINSAVKKRLISDVPVGAFLSGGIDSSTIVSSMKNFHKGDLHTFSAGFSNKNYNELNDAELTANYLNTKHHTTVLGKENNETYLINLVNNFNELFSDNSFIPMKEVSKLASNYVKVVLTGDGADELFAGYITYKADRYLPYYKVLLPYFFRKKLAKKRKVDPNKKIGFDFKLQQFSNGSLFDYQKAHYSWREIFTPEERVNILGEEYRDLINDTDPFNQFKKYYKKVEKLDLLDQHLYVDAMTWLTDDILLKVDRTAMKESLEARSPFLDIDLVEYVASIPSELKLTKFLNSKHILKKTVKSNLPKFVLKKKKSGFNTPIYSWLPQKYNNEFQDFNIYMLKNFLTNYEKRTNNKYPIRL